MNGTNGKNGNGSIKLTISHLLQSIIIILLTVIGYMFIDSRADIKSIDSKVDDLTLNQVVIQKELIQNQTEHDEIKEIIRNNHEKNNN